ncbi:unnamed protein product [Cuscuta campestris]|uniref:Uncharacterized protein n=1 Tax=Cuscuta campestris TaxID=132261 RepID=A0A484KL48_9ASTE|nr:unnamed protein product [Cuscuta campestris]
MTSETNTPGYWLNWRFLVSLVGVLAAMVVSAVIIWRYEGSSKSRNEDAEDSKKRGILRKDEVWKTCYKSLHPVWLLAYRILAFLLLLGLLIGDVVLHSGGIFFYYTEWTFTLVTIYFGVGSLQSIYGLKSCKELSADRIHMVTSDPENGPYIHRDTAGFGDYAVQIIFQMCAGAVVLTDIVFWLIIYPFLTSNDYRLNFLAVCMHSVNAICLLGEVALNRLQFPFFRIAYFVMWTCVFVTFQWILHMCVSLWWPYTFLDLSSPYAPLWYFGVGALHVPCFLTFTLIMRTKRYLLSRFLENSAVGI